MVGNCLATDSNEEAGRLRPEEPDAGERGRLGVYLKTRLTGLSSEGRTVSLKVLPEKDQNQGVQPWGYMVREVCWTRYATCCCMLYTNPQVAMTLLGVA